MTKKILIRFGLGFMGIALLTMFTMTIMSVVTARPMFDERLLENDRDNIEIFPIDRALTFARYKDNNYINLILVDSYVDGVISGVNISSLDTKLLPDPISFFNKYGYDGIIKLKEQSLTTVKINSEELIKSAVFGSNNIAVGYNYVSHVEELDEEEPPFLYPKKVVPDNFDTSINTMDYTLPDYELELGIVLLNNVTPSSEPQDYYGFILVNDFSDRMPIVQKHMDVIFGKYEALADGIQGYPEAKNKNNACPTGNLFVIPRDYKEFINTIELKLYLNGDLRQNAKPVDLIWGPEKIIEEVFIRSNWKFQKGTEDWFLLEYKDFIPSGTIFLTGTSEGVIFKKTNMWNPAVFLKPGDDILLIADGLGKINNKITK